MISESRDIILEKLKVASRSPLVGRPPRPVLAETGFDQTQMLERFNAELISRGGAVHTARSAAEAGTVLAEIVAMENIKSMITAGSPRHVLDVHAFGSKHGLEIMESEKLRDRAALRESAFAVDAGLTFADFAVAETGTIGLIIKEGQPRLVSIAPPIHVAVVSVQNLHPVYEDVLRKVFRRVPDFPSQFCFITGPSSTTDIQCVEFKGMHGPIKMIVIFVMAGA